MYPFLFFSLFSSSPSSPASPLPPPPLLPLLPPLLPLFSPPSSPLLPLFSPPSLPFLPPSFLLSLFLLAWMDTLYTWWWQCPPQNTSCMPDSHLAICHLYCIRHSSAELLSSWPGKCLTITSLDCDLSALVHPVRVTRYVYRSIQLSEQLVSMSCCPDNTQGTLFTYCSL